MTTYELDNSKTGWLLLPGDAEDIVAHYKDGHKETMKVWQFVALGKKQRNLITKIDCYCKGEKIKED